uniref:Uncharacterized protein n=1 Tax=Anguilla anguilla TaxID=7936 RepID=A0A0E9X8C6_ANGAN
MICWESFLFFLFCFFKKIYNCAIDATIHHWQKHWYCGDRKEDGYFSNH